MRISCGITVNGTLCPSDLFESIVHLKPDGRRGQDFSLTAQPGDEQGAQLVERIAVMCKERGLDSIRGSYVHGVAVHYEPQDFAAAPLLWLMGQRRLFKHNDADIRDEFGRVWLPASDAKPSVKIASIFCTPWIVVSDAVRRTLESGGLAGLRFDEVSIKGHSVHASPAPFWEMRSSVTLPKMVNSVPDTGADYDPPRFLVHDSHGEPHYRQGELQAVGAFDIAHTFERLKGGEPALIVSQRFYQHCLKQKIPLEVRPVRIDLD